MEAKNKKLLTKREATRRNWIIGIVLTLCAFLSVLFFVYGKVQQMSAEFQLKRAVTLELENLKLKNENEQLKQEILGLKK